MPIMLVEVRGRAELGRAADEQKNPKSCMTNARETRRRLDSPELFCSSSPAETPKVFPPDFLEAFPREGRGECIDPEEGPETRRTILFVLPPPESGD